ncbi:hypothetical protein HMPREF0204_12480 [Chryseobacterium gleum ATCC 35910]|uniref:Uncharacterized protein n=1 Tax=Chryseobacterium gleum ATCC 35910 TaxID=525257 RepID=A0ABN0AK65_CHRGE|nr:hypothetical protein HMPREF0204_12480 [Chryseobacterium gleum ATCC 35910]
MAKNDEKTLNFNTSRKDYLPHITHLLFYHSSSITYKYKELGILRSG